MKSLFPQFDTIADRDYSGVWKDALFVFDTNVLLNLYRYQSSTRDELINLLGRLSKRIWVPHHVALEFQRNRLKVIAEQSKRFTDVRKAVDKARASLCSDIEKLQLHRRHSLINAQPLIVGFDDLAKDFLVGLDKLQETQQKVSAHDPLKEKIESLFDGRVGQAPESQASVDELYKQADARFKMKIPPGYQDSEKDRDAPDEHVQGGIIYKRKYGDFLIWDQLLTYAKSAEIKSVIFVTDDGKDDWWWKIDSDGPKTVGPRPELIDEARFKGGIETLLMYNPEGLLKYAKDLLQAPVSDETLTEVRDVSNARLVRNVSFREFRENTLRAERAVFSWIQAQFGKVKENRRGFPDFVTEQDGKIIGFEVNVVSQPRLAIHRMREVIYRAYYEIREGRLSELSIVWVVGNHLEADEIKRIIIRTSVDEMPDSLRMIIGAVADSDSGEVGFLPFEDFAYVDASHSFDMTS